MLTRRQVLQRGAIGSAGLLAGRAPLTKAAPVSVGATPNLRRWVEVLPVPPVLDGRGGGKRFTIAARESTTWRFHRISRPRGPGAMRPTTRAPGLPYLGPTIEATRPASDAAPTPVTIDWRNELGNAFLPERSRR